MADSDSDMEGWLEWDKKGFFRCHVPPYATVGLRDEGSTAVILLGTKGRGTEVLISNFPLGKSTLDRTEHAIALRDTADDFLGKAVPKAVGHAVPYDIEVTEEPDQRLYYAQGIALVEQGRVWLVRVYARRGEDRFWIIHWNGPMEVKSDVLRIFVTFEPAVSSAEAS